MLCNVTYLVQYNIYLTGYKHLRLHHLTDHLLRVRQPEAKILDAKNQKRVQYAFKLDITTMTAI